VSGYPDDLWHSLADLSGLLLTEESLETTLRRVADLAVRSIAACDAVGVTLFEDSKPTTRAATGGLVYEVDNYQYDIGEGPCLQSVYDQRSYEIRDMTVKDRWPRFCEHAAERGIHSSLSLPLTVRGQTLGALNLYSRLADAFTDADRETALLFASQAPSHWPTPRSTPRASAWQRSSVRRSSRAP
jgi:transcriptional regulator with GAF, ATPase, and Fis domain